MELNNVKNRKIIWLTRFLRHLWNCLKYVDMNMVRAGAVDHPSKWLWCGYQETAGPRKRYRLIDREALMNALGDEMTMDAFKKNYSVSIAETISAREFTREAMWSESLAVGSERFVEEVEKSLKNRSRKEIIEPEDRKRAYILRESGLKYA
jgi:putative transposase